MNIAENEVEIIVASSILELETHRNEWNKLVKNSPDNNIYFTPQFLIPALRHYQEEGAYLVLFFYELNNGKHRLIGVIPLIQKPPTWRLPCRTAVTQPYPHCYLSYPLLDKNNAAKTIYKLNEWLDSQGEFCDVIMICTIPRESETWNVLQKVISGNKWTSYKSLRYKRPMLKRTSSFNDYLENLPKKRQKEYRRLRKRLFNAGEVSFKLHRNNRDDPDLAERFLALEQQSWRRTSGSALASRSNDADYFREIVNISNGDIYIFFIEMILNGVPIAMTTNFINGKTLFAFKVAYNQEYSKLSPGILLEFECVRLMYEKTDFLLADSGAEEESYIGRYWLQRSEIMLVYLARNAFYPRFCLKVLCIRRSIKRMLINFKYWTNILTR